MSLEDLLAEAACWVDGAAWGDGGERPQFELSWYRGKWHAEASSFYDGGGEGVADDPADAIGVCLEGVRGHPERERQRVRSESVHALARHLRCSTAEAERQVAAIEGAP